MSDNPTKPIATRANSYPEQTEMDAVQGVARAAIAAIPLIGGTITELVSLVMAPAVERRKDEWLKELADALDELEAKFDDFKIEDLQHNEQFVSAVIEASRSAISTHRLEKRQALRNALLNIALHRLADEDLQETFLRYIDDLTVWHLRFLWVFQDPQRALTTKGNRANSYGLGGADQILETVYAELSGRRDIYDQIATDLFNRGLLNTPADFLHTMMTASGTVAKRTTPLADNFLDFISNPFQ
jgi:hypothetical protein